MKKLKYINGQRVGGVPTNIARIQTVKRAANGAISLVAAPQAAKTTVGTAALTRTETLTLGLTGTGGGRNFVKAKFFAINTSAGKKATLTGSVKTVNGTQKLGTAKGTTTASASLSNTAALPIKVPGSLKIKAKGTAGKIGTVKFTAGKVNDLTALMF